VADLFVEPREASEHGTHVWVGIGEGLQDAIAHELGGVVRLVTFSILQVDEPLPEGEIQFE